MAIGGVNITESDYFFRFYCEDVYIYIWPVKGLFEVFCLINNVNITDMMLY